MPALGNTICASVWISLRQRSRQAAPATGVHDLEASNHSTLQMPLSSCATGLPFPCISSCHRLCCTFSIAPHHDYSHLTPALSVPFPSLLLTSRAFAPSSPPSSLLSLYLPVPRSPYRIAVSWWHLPVPLACRSPVSPLATVSAAPSLSLHTTTIPT